MFLRKDLFNKHYPNGFHSECVKLSEPLEYYYYITFDCFFDRLLKISKIKKINIELINFYNFYLDNSVSIYKALEGILTEELNENINNQIIEFLKKTKNKNYE